MAALEAVLHPGEVLYLPPYVFHRVGGGGGGGEVGSGGKLDDETRRPDG